MNSSLLVIDIIFRTTSDQIKTTIQYLQKKREMNNNIKLRILFQIQGFQPPCILDSLFFKSRISWAYNKIESDKTMMYSTFPHHISPCNTNLEKV